MFIAKWTARFIKQNVRSAVPLFLLLLLVSVTPAWLFVAHAFAQTPEDATNYLPLIEDQEEQVTPAATIAAGSRVYGLLGRLSQPSGMRYSYYLTTVDSGFYALAGLTPAIEEQITALANTSESPLVKVWGEVRPVEGAGEPPLIVVTGILGAETVTPTPVAGLAVPVATVKFDVVNLYSGPGANYEVVGQVVYGQACEVTGRNQTNAWLQMTCGDGQQGWVDARLVEVNSPLSEVLVINTTPPTATPTPTPVAPTPAPTPATISAWRTEIFNNTGLVGSPVAVVDSPSINFNWGSGGPSQVSPDNFSIRFTRRISISPAYYQFTAMADDGVHVWVDGRLILNAWPANPSQSYTAGMVLTGVHDIQVDYYEQSGLANVSVAYTPAPSNGTWQAGYYYGTTPSGEPAFTQEEPAGSYPLDYNWSTTSPQSISLGANVLGNDYWSARWEGEFLFESGNIIFNANVDDAIRLYLDGLLVLDQWSDGYKQVSNRVLGVGSGQHSVVVEYYERTGNASIRVWWYRDSAYAGPQ